MLVYNKKSAILERLGKDKKDIRYLERAIERGEVLEIDGYYIRKDDLLRVAFEVLHNENILLKKEVENVSGNSRELEEAKAARKELEINVEYYEKENNDLRDKNIALESILEGLRAKWMDIGYANE